MVYYVDDVVNEGWSVVVHIKPRDLYDMGEEVEENAYENEPYQEQQLEQFSRLDDQYLYLISSPPSDSTQAPEVPTGNVPLSHVSTSEDPQEDEITRRHVGCESTHCWTVEAIGIQVSYSIFIPLYLISSPPSDSTQAPEVPTGNVPLSHVSTSEDPQEDEITRRHVGCESTHCWTVEAIGFLGTLAADCKLFPMDYDRWSGPSGVPKAYFDDCFETILKELCRRNKEIRSKQVIPHTGGFKANPRRRNELLLETGKLPSRGQLYIETHKRKDGSFVNEAAKTIAEQIEVGLTQSIVDESKVSPLDVVGRVLGLEHSGRVRCMGLGVVPSNTIRNTRL
eukprot:XP_025983805.1 uncharacterized protein LOC100817477 [Glycine max]